MRFDLRPTVLAAGALFVATLLLAACSSADAGASLPDLQPFSSALQTKLHEIRDRIAEIRGLPVNEEAVEGEVSRDALRAYSYEQSAEMTDEERRELESYNIALRLMRLIGPDDDLFQLFTGHFAGDTLGFYNFEDDELVLIAENSTEINGSDAIILAHEYVHSFQDRAFDSEKLNKLAEEEEEGAPTEYSVTVSCLKEGDASLAMVQYGEAVFGPDWHAKTFGADEGDDEDDPSEPPSPFIERYFNFDYSECPRFVNALHEKGGWDAVDDAYADPPWTTEQILHPDKYVAREDVRSGPPDTLVDALGDGWKRLDLSIFGEFDVYNYLATLLQDERLAAVAASGWGSGWIAVYTADAGGAGADPQVLVHLRLDFDSTDDLAQFMFAYGNVVQKVSDGKWEIAGPDGPARWRGDGEFGYVTWDGVRNQVDIVITSDEDTREAAAGGL